jgi:hypothetical protein
VVGYDGTHLLDGADLFIDHKFNDGA